MNTNWPRWIAASIFKHITDQISDYPVYFEGQKIHSLEDADYMYLRVNGPKFRKLSSDYWRIDISLNMLVQHVLDSNILKEQEMTGVVSVAFDQDIPIKKYGDKVGDDASQISCLKVIDDGVAITPFGQVQDGVEITQSTVLCYYKAELKV